MSQLVIYPTHYFYWQVKFEDGFVLSKFDDNGNEFDLKSEIPEKCYYEYEGRRCINFNKNIFENLELIHGRTTEISWIPFTNELKEKIKVKQPTMRIDILLNPVTYKKIIPTGFFAYMKMQIGLETKVSLTDKGADVIYGKGSLGAIYLGYIPREGTKSLGEVDRIDLNVEEMIQ